MKSEECDMYRFTIMTGQEKTVGNRKETLRPNRKGRMRTPFSHEELDMTFGEFVEAYTGDTEPKLKHNTWPTKGHLLQAKLLPYFGNNNQEKLSNI